MQSASLPDLLYGQMLIHDLLVNIGVEMHMPYMYMSVDACFVHNLAFFQLYFFVISNRISTYLSLTSGSLGLVISVLTRSQFNKTFTSVICKCSHCLRALSICQKRPARPYSYHYESFTFNQNYPARSVKS